MKSHTPDDPRTARLTPKTDRAGSRPARGPKNMPRSKRKMRRGAR